MAKPSALKFKPPRGLMPAMQFLLPSQLSIDPSYQRDIESGESQALIRRIAIDWNWDLCQPLVVSRRDNGDLFVIDGQHRLAAARLRGDIAQLPAVVVSYASAADEASSFVQLNQQRRPLSKLNLFRAAVASGDAEAVAIEGAIRASGLSIAPHMTSKGWKPGMIGNIGGIEASWRAFGGPVTRAALQALKDAFSGQVLSYAGTLFPGIAAVCADEKFTDAATARFDKFVTMLSLRSQDKWRADIAQVRVDDPNLGFAKASATVMRRAWAVADGRAPKPPMPKVVLPPPKPAKSPPASDGPIWCSQCEQRVQAAQASACSSPYCKAKAVAA